MKKGLTILKELTETSNRLIFLLTLFLLVHPSFHPAYATDFTSDANITNTADPRQSLSPIVDDEAHRKLGLLLNYVREEGPKYFKSLPNMPGFVRDPSGWAFGGLRGLGLGGLGLSGPSLDGEGDEIADMFRPVAALIQPPGAGEAEAMWISPNYHHKGFLPFHDAVMMGFNVRHSVFNNLVRFEAHPYFGQNMLSADHYWGTEIAVNFGDKIGPNGEVKTGWGKISINYMEGDPSLMDRGHGIDLHSEFRFDDHLALHAGVRDDNDSTLGNYVLLRWKLIGD